MPTDDLPGLKIPRSRRKRKKGFPLGRAIVDSLSTWTVAPLVAYVRKEWRYLKKYPGILVLALLLTAVGSWWGWRWWYVEKPYTGITKMVLFFPGDGSEPQAVSKANIYRASTMGIEMQFTTPKDDKQINVSKGRVWVVDLIFDKQIDAENMLFVGSGLDSNVRLEIRDFTGRSAVVLIAPNELLNKANPSEPINPKGVLELKAITRTSFSPDNLRPPSPTPTTTPPSSTPDMEASPP